MLEYGKGTIWQTKFENPALLAWYEFSQTSKMNRMESRIHRVYQRVKQGIKPWEWDWEHYSGENSDMVGFYYPEDIAAMEQLKDFERQNKQQVQQQ